MTSALAKGGVSPKKTISSNATTDKLFECYSDNGGDLMDVIKVSFLNLSRIQIVKLSTDCCSVAFSSAAESMAARELLDESIEPSLILSALTKTLISAPSVTVINER